MRRHDVCRKWGQGFSGTTVEMKGGVVPIVGLVVLVFAGRVSPVLLLSFASFLVPSLLSFSLLLLFRALVSTHHSKFPMPNTMSAHDASWVLMMHPDFP